MAEIKVWIEEGCISCGLCVDLCPEVFEYEDDLAVVKQDVNPDPFRNQIREAADGCPVEVIQYEE
jgi:ferredoxin